ncbi:hypothetical protein ABPG74_013143 [Tetrahymena malaccensis]
MLDELSETEIVERIIALFYYVNERRIIALNPNIENKCDISTDNLKIIQPEESQSIFKSALIKQMWSKNNHKTLKQSMSMINKSIKSMSMNYLLVNDSELTYQDIISTLWDQVKEYQQISIEQAVMRGIQEVKVYNKMIEDINEKLIEEQSEQFIEYIYTNTSLRNYLIQIQRDKYQLSEDELLDWKNMKLDQLTRYQSRQTLLLRMEVEQIIIKTQNKSTNILMMAHQHTKQPTNQGKIQD